MNLNRVSQVDNLVKIRNVLISVADKTNLDTLVNGLISVNPDVGIYSTGGTYGKIKELADPAKSIVKEISMYTGQPEMQGGLVKTLDFKIYLGLLSETYNPAHQKDMVRLGAIPFDLVVVNLYPFSKTVEIESATIEDGRTHIDIGGPSMLRASAKNFLRVASICDPSLYHDLIQELKVNHGYLSLKTRFKYAQAVFRHTAEYDTAIADFLSKCTERDLTLDYHFADNPGNIL